MPTTISALPGAPTPLTGNEVVPADVTSGGATDRFTTGDVAKLAELYAAVNLVAWPERFDGAGTYFSTQGAGAPLTTWFAPTIAVAAGYGNVAQYTGSAVIYTRGAAPAGPSKVYEIEAEIEQVSVGGGETPAARVGIYAMKSDYTSATTPSVSSALTVTPAAQVTVIKARFAFAAGAGMAAWGSPSEAVFLRPFAEINRKSDDSGAAATSVARVRRLKVTDVTAQAGAEMGGESVSTPAITAGVLTLDLAGGKRNFKVTLNANVTSIVFTNIPSGPDEFSWTLRFIGDGTARTVAWPAAVHHNFATTPSVNTTAGAETRFTMVTENGGTLIKNYKAGEIT